ncbi:peptidase inhibitor family I36 protein [Streptomyces sp. NPDC085932]|uniref:peptidase inhibitor family I36 protein n=1 Tax=Streptomyces sp. NPDC085932 TaxID=3365741 RepID=UPI0037D86B47
MAHLRTGFTIAVAILAPAALFLAPHSATATAPATPQGPIQITSRDVCPQGLLCMYQHADFQGGGYGISPGWDLNDFRGINFNDHISSIANSTDNRYCWYPDINYKGTPRTIDSGQATNVDLTTENDTASSLADC